MALTAVDRLIVFAGVSCCGKTTLMQELLAGKQQELGGLLELGNPAQWRYLRAKDSWYVAESWLPAVLLHYDLLRTWKWSVTGRTCPEAEPQPIFDAAQEITLVTVTAPAAELQRRYRSKQRSRHGFWSRLTEWRHPARARSRAIEQLFRDEQLLQRAYTDWLGWCARYPTRGHWLVDTGKQPAVVRPLDAASKMP